MFEYDRFHCDVSSTFKIHVINPRNGSCNSVSVHVNCLGLGSDISAGTAVKSVCVCVASHVFRTAKQHFAKRTGRCGTMLSSNPVHECLFTMKTSKEKQTQEKPWFRHQLQPCILYSKQNGARTEKQPSVTQRTTSVSANTDKKVNAMSLSSAQQSTTTQLQDLTDASRPITTAAQVSDMGAWNAHNPLVQFVTFFDRERHHRPTRYTNCVHHPDRGCPNRLRTGKRIHHVSR